MAPITLVMGPTLVPVPIPSPVPFPLAGPGPGAPPVVPGFAPLPAPPHGTGRARTRRSGEVRDLDDGRQVGGQVRVL
ncbi:hypothetical protein ACSNOK_13795 [Streptomyces sp. URMC 126]|uniref:hypothetical protein n=1 Tax=Streptomyces sp. URMC 126 TaxID=3423401 RepID=UPI003F1BDC44